MLLLDAVSIGRKQGLSRMHTGRVAGLLCLFEKKVNAQL